MAVLWRLMTLRWVWGRADVNLTAMVARSSAGCVVFLCFAMFRQLSFYDETENPRPHNVLGREDRDIQQRVKALRKVWKDLAWREWKRGRGHSVHSRDADILAANVRAPPTPVRTEAPPTPSGVTARSLLRRLFSRPGGFREPPHRGETDPVLYRAPSTPPAPKPEAEFAQELAAETVAEPVPELPPIKP